MGFFQVTAGLPLLGVILEEEIKMKQPAQWSRYVRVCSFIYVVSAVTSALLMYSSPNIIPLASWDVVTLFQ